MNTYYFKKNITKLNLTVVDIDGRGYVMGNTYPVRNKLKFYGCWWSSEHKAWAVHHAARAEVELFCTGRYNTGFNI